MEPTKAACTTLSNPARRAKIPKNNSGRLPSALWMIPVAPGENRLPR